MYSSLASGRQEAADKREHPAKSIRLLNRDYKVATGVSQLGSIPIQLSADHSLFETQAVRVENGHLRLTREEVRTATRTTAQSVFIFRRH